MSETAETPKVHEPTLKQLISGFLGELQGRSEDKFIRYLVLINFIILFTRPQNDLVFLQYTKFSIILSVVAGVFWLSRIKKGWNTATKAMMLFLLLMTIRGVFAKNNRWAFFLWLDVANLYTCYLFPIIVFCCHGRDLKRFLIWFLFIGIYLGLYSVSNRGQGPGGFLTDENDLCLALILLLCLPLTYIFRHGPITQRLWYGGGIAIILAGIVKTWSRGGFVGLVIALFYLLWRARATFAALVFVVSLVLGGAILVPKAYWNEMYTIKQTDQGTAKQRRELWATGIRVWLSPRFFIYGVGQGNSPFYLGEFEPSENKSAQRRSIAGRAVHSIFVQLVSELGLIGLIIFSVVVVSSVQGNRKSVRQVRIMAAAFAKLSAVATKLNRERTETTDEIGQNAMLIEEGITLKDIGAVARTAEQELFFLETLFIAFNGTWLGVLGAAAFLSTLYYPPIWILVGFSACAQFYLRNLIAYLEPLETRLSNALQVRE